MNSEAEIALGELLEGVVSLAAGLRNTTRRLHSKERLSDAGRGLLVALEALGALTVPQLARNRATSRQNVRILANRLKRAGWVEFAANPDHKKSELVRLTESGKRRLRSANQRQAALLANLLPHVTEDEVRACSELLNRITGLLGGEARASFRPRRASKHPRRPPKAETEQAGAAIALEQPDASASFAEPEELPVSLL